MSTPDLDLDHLALEITFLALADADPAEKDRKLSEISARWAPFVHPDQVDDFFERLKARARALHLVRLPPGRA